MVEQEYKHADYSAKNDSKPTDQKYSFIKNVSNPKLVGTPLRINWRQKRRKKRLLWMATCAKGDH